MIEIPGTVYLVGGAVRDKLLEIETDSHDRDWVVTGAIASEMEQAGFRSVGREFPVFLHPETHEEYALARTESKSGKGHTGFLFRSDSRISIEQDLLRRDLTINAMAIDKKGRLIDPFGGQNDLEARILRHVSEAFAEDPLRVYRVARFAAMFPQFEIAEETMQLMTSMKGELAELSAERVWAEYFKAISGLTPFRFYDVLDQAEVLHPWFDDLAIDRVKTVMRERWLRDRDAVAAIGWVHDENTAVAHLRKLKAPGKMVRLARDVARYGQRLFEVDTKDAEEVLSLFERSGAIRGSEAFAALVSATEACTGVEMENVSELANRLRRIRVSGVPQNQYERALKEARLRAIRQRQVNS